VKQIQDWENKMGWFRHRDSQKSERQRFYLSPAIITSVIFAVCGVLLVSGTYNEARDYLRRKAEDYLKVRTENLGLGETMPPGWKPEEHGFEIVTPEEAASQDSIQLPVNIDPETRRVLLESQKEIEKLKHGYWVNLSTEELVVLCTIAGLCGGILGYCFVLVVPIFGEAMKPTAKDLRKGFNEVVFYLTECFRYSGRQMLADIIKWTIIIIISAIVFTIAYKIATKDSGGPSYIDWRQTRGRR
jgi:hypothetical protein